MTAPTKTADMTTYRRADGEPIGGDYKFVTETEWLDDEVGFGNEPLLVVEERWERVSSRTLMLCPPHMLCSACEGEGEVVDDLPEPQDCPRCNGTGEDPNAGQTIEVPS